MPLRSALLAGLVLASPGAAVAQGTTAAAAPPVAASDGAMPATPADTAGPVNAGDGAATLHPGDVIDFAADGMEYSQDDEIVTAIGHVVIDRNRYHLTADRVIYNRVSGQVEARGNVTTTDPNGNKVYGDRVILAESLKDGAIDNILLVLADGGRLVASSAVRVNGVSTLKRAVYSPCPVTADNGCPKTPVWQIKAVRIIHDPARRRIYYRQAQVEILGHTVFYLPAFSHPDGSSGRATGLLVPEVEVRNTLGVGLGVPYHIDLGPDRDLTVKPWLFTEVKPALDVRYRQLFAAGPVQIRAYGTYSDVVDYAPDGVTTIDRGQRPRGYLEANGQLQHDDEWRSTFLLRLTTDDTFDERYGLNYDDSLRSTYSLERFRQDSYLSITGWGFQDLRANKGPDTTPIVLPVVNYSWRPEDKLLGGQIELTGNFLNLFRIEGQDIQRGIVAAQWTRSWLTAMGQRITATALLRGDLYNTLNAAGATLPEYAGQKGVAARGIAVGALDAEWPFAGPLLGGTQTITPRVQLVAAPLSLNRGIPDEDSRSLDLEVNNLFALNRFSGYDRYESGARVTYGVNYRYTRPRLAISGELGESVRLSGTDDQLLLQGSGLASRFSDIVGRVTVQYADLFSITDRFRIDSGNGVLRRHEVDIAAGSAKTYVTIGYANLNRNLILEDLRDFQELRAGARVALGRYWSAFGSVIIDLTTKTQEPTTTANGFAPIRHRLGVQYEDSCFRFGLTWRRDYTSDRDFRAGNSYLLTVAFKNLGR